MTEPTIHEIVVTGRPGTQLLRPLVDDFAVERLDGGGTRLVGTVRDPAHLHGLVAHLTSVGVDVVRFGPVDHPHPPVSDRSTP